MAIAISLRSLGWVQLLRLKCRGARDIDIGIRPRFSKTLWYGSIDRGCQGLEQTLEESHHYQWWQELHSTYLHLVWPSLGAAAQPCVIMTLLSRVISCMSLRQDGCLASSHWIHNIKRTLHKTSLGGWVNVSIQTSKVLHIVCFLQNLCRLQDYSSEVWI